MSIKDKLKKNVWSTDIYYKEAKEASLNVSHQGIVMLKKFSDNAEAILDMGCGEGTRLNSIYTTGKKLVGVDISEKGILLGRENYPYINFQIADLEHLNFNDQSFDLVYSVCVLEHLSNPEIVIKEAIRVTRSSGYILLIAPNYGAPNRCSPPFKGSRVNKLVSGLVSDFCLVFAGSKLKWGKVSPIADKDNYHSDWDTTIEPYIGSLIKYLKHNNLKMKYFNSCWSEELPHARFHQRIFRLFGEFGLYPFNLWGPHLVVVAQKVI